MVVGVDINEYTAGGGGCFRVVRSKYLSTLLVVVVSGRQGPPDPRVPLPLPEDRSVAPGKTSLEASCRLQNAKNDAFRNNGSNF